MSGTGRKRVFARIGIVRLLIFFILLTMVYGGGQAGIAQIVRRAPLDMTSEVAAGGTVLLCILLISVYALLVGVLERRDIRELALGRGVPLLIGGLILGFTLFAAVYGVLFGLHDATWLGFSGYTGVLSFALMAVLAGIGEELIFRGGIFRILEDMFGTSVALLFSGALFGALHLINTHATLFSSLAIALEAGVLLAAAYAATRNLWLPIGIHIGWNFTEGGVFGAAVSGNGGGHGIVKMPLHGPDLLTGGAFGPEASLIAVTVCGIAGLFFMVRTIQRGRWVRASFNMMLD